MHACAHTHTHTNRNKHTKMKLIRNASKLTMVATTRVPARRWWGTPTPKEMGRTPKQTSRMWGD